MRERKLWKTASIRAEAPAFGQKEAGPDEKDIKERFGQTFSSENLVQRARSGSKTILSKTLKSRERTSKLWGHARNWQRIEGLRLSSESHPRLASKVKRWKTDD